MKFLSITKVKFCLTLIAEEKVHPGQFSHQKTKPSLDNLLWDNLLWDNLLRDKPPWDNPFGITYDCGIL